MLQKKINLFIYVSILFIAISGKPVVRPRHQGSVHWLYSLQCQHQLVLYCQVCFVNTYLGDFTYSDPQLGPNGGEFKVNYSQRLSASHLAFLLPYLGLALIGALELTSPPGLSLYLKLWWEVLANSRFHLSNIIGDFNWLLGRWLAKFGQIGTFWCHLIHSLRGPSLVQFWKTRSPLGGIEKSMSLSLSLGLSSGGPSSYIWFEFELTPRKMVSSDTITLSES